MGMKKPVEDILQLGKVTPSIPALPSWTLAFVDLPFHPTHRLRHLVQTTTPRTGLFGDFLQQNAYCIRSW